jgi:hypothetical protein
MTALRAAFAHHQVALPLRLNNRDTGVLFDAGGRDVVTVDVNRDRTDGQVASIAELLALSVNALEALLGALDRVEGEIAAGPTSSAMGELLTVRANLRDKIREARP